MPDPGRRAPTDPRQGGLKASQAEALLHIMKLAVGIRDVAHLRAVQKARAKADPPLRHHTRNMPKRAVEIVDGGSIYWVIAGAMMARQAVREIIADSWDDGSACAGLVLDPALVAVSPRLTRPFQGWRYLAADDAPPDLIALPRGAGEAAMPADMQRALRSLGLL
jgi:hypothetical protein